MRIRELLRLVWQNIAQNKSKTILTSIGILVGAGTIVMVISIGKGGKMDVEEQFRNLNAGAIDISCNAAQQTKNNKRTPFGGGMPPENGGAQMGGGGRQSENGAMQPGNGGMRPEGDGTAPSGSNDIGQGMPPDGEMPPGGEVPSDKNGLELPSDGSIPDDSSSKSPSSDSDTGNEDTKMRSGNPRTGSAAAEWVTLTENDTAYLLENMYSISESTISYTTRASVEGGDLEEAAVYTIAGVQENYASISNLKLSAGEFLSPESEENKEKSCILGAAAAEEIFGSVMEAYGSVLYIDQRIYVVDGVLEAMGSVASGISPDNAVFIPYATGIKYLTGEDVNPTITILAEDTAQIDQAMAEAESLLAERYPNSSFTLADAGSKMEAAEASNRILTMLLFAMAALVFAVGGIGIMNVLFVSVKERTNEIGILKAIGCPRSNILTEFLLEAAAISLVGGVLGSLASFAVTPLVRAFGIRVELSVPAYLSALLFAVVTGTVFGFYPAYKAAKLVPIDALGAE